LRQDPRVVVVERTNFRFADPEACGAPFAFVSSDVSFISLTKLADQFERFLASDGRLVALIKPQFEAGRNAVSRRGVVRDETVHVEAIEKVIDAFARRGIVAQHLTYSPLAGPEGNVEFFLGAAKKGERSTLHVLSVVRRARAELLERPASSGSNRSE